MQVMLTPAELHIVLRLVGKDSLHGIPDSYAGWFASEREQSVAQATLTLAAAQHVVFDGTELQLGDGMARLMAPIKELHDAVVLVRESNRHPQGFIAIYTDRMSSQTVCLTRAGTNAYTLEQCEWAEATSRVVTFGMDKLYPTDVIGDSFQLSAQNMNKLFLVNPLAQHETVRLTATHWHLGATDTQMLAFVRQGWWQIESIGDMQTFIPIDSTGAEGLLRAATSRVSI